MKFDKAIPVRKLFQTFDVEIFGKEGDVTGMNEIHRVEQGDLAFVDHPKYYEKTLASRASFILIDKKVDVPEGKTIIVCAFPFSVYNELASKYIEQDLIHPESTNKLHPSVTIEPGAIVHPDAEIGEGSIIRANAVIGPKVSLGRNVIVHFNACIGTDAFYYHRSDGKMTKWHTIGSVRIEDDVEIGAACTISRGVSSQTFIGQGSKLDAQVHVGHGVKIGEHCLIAAQAGISGKTIIEDHCVVYGQAGLAQNLRIGSKSVISAKAGVAKDLEGNATYFGIPARPMKEFYREFISLRKLPDIIQSWKKSRS